MPATDFILDLNDPAAVPLGLALGDCALLGLAGWIFTLLRAVTDIDQFTLLLRLSPGALPSLFAGPAANLLNSGTYLNFLMLEFY